MQFLKEIREHLANFETEAELEIHRFIDWLHTKYIEPGAPVVAPPEMNYVQNVPTFTPALDAAPVADPAPVAEPVSAPAEPVVAPQVEAELVEPAAIVGSDVASDAAVKE